MNIEKAAAVDSIPLCELLQKQLQEHDLFLEGARLQAAIERLISEEGLGFILTAKEGGKLVGCAVVSFAWTLEHGGRSAWLDELYILPEFRGLGFGAQLLDQVLAHAAAGGCQAVDLEVDREHQRAENLYQRKGFQKLQRNRWVKQFHQ